MAKQGSPEWFYEKSQTTEMKELNKTIERRRKSFTNCFSKKRLHEMSGDELLSKVFSDAPSSMLRLLMYDEDYRWFGAPGKYKYLGIVYQGHGDTWKYKPDHHALTISHYEAEKKAGEIRDQLINCIQAIESQDVFRTVQDYQTLENQIQGVFFSRYAWVLKYFQMLFPQYFPGMYEERTLNRALHILGLPSSGKSKRLLNAGEISLFIRKCNVNNIVFNTIYDNEWGWVDDRQACEAAEDNMRNSGTPISDVNLNNYA